MLRLHTVRYAVVQGVHSLLCVWIIAFRTSEKQLANGGIVFATSWTHWSPIGFFSSATLELAGWATGELPVMQGREKNSIPTERHTVGKAHFEMSLFTLADGEILRTSDAVSWKDE